MKWVRQRCQLAPVSTEAMASPIPRAAGGADHRGFLANAGRSGGSKRLTL